MNSYLLNIKNLKDKNILIGSKKTGLIKIRKTKNDKEIVLDVDDKFGKVGNNNFDALNLFSFYTNRGIELKSMLTYGGNYLNYSLSSSMSPLAIYDFDVQKFDNLFVKLNKLCSSKKNSEFKKGEKINNLLETYNNARLMLPRFWNESYLNLVRILDFHIKPESSKSLVFPDKNIRILPKRFMKDIFSKLEANAFIKDNHIEIALNLFRRLSRSADFRRAEIDLNYYKENYQKLFYSILFVLHTYRSKFVHDGFPFPSKIKGMLPGKENEVFNYFAPSMGESKAISYSPYEGHDIHKSLNISFEKRFGRNYQKMYLLLPGWSFLNLIVKEIIKFHLKRV